MSNSTMGPMTVGANVPTINGGSGGGTDQYGNETNPGFNQKAKFTSRTPAKFKSFKREQVPVTGGKLSGD